MPVKIGINGFGRIGRNTSSLTEIRVILAIGLRDNPTSRGLTATVERHRVPAPGGTARGISLIGADGQAYEVGNRMILYRPGRSENKPFCNGAHAADPKFCDGHRWTARYGAGRSDDFTKMLEARAKRNDYQSERHFPITSDPACIR